MFCPKFRQCIFTVISLILFTGLQSNQVHAQSDAATPNIDPRLIEIVKEVRLRAIPPKSVETSIASLEIDSYAERRIQAAMRIQEAAYSQDPKSIRTAISEFERVDKKIAFPSMARIGDLYSRHADLLAKKVSIVEQQLDIKSFEQTGSWLERYFAVQLSQHLYSEANERQAPLQKAQYAFQLIPNNEPEKAYIQFAKAGTYSVLAQLHNIQGNIDFAIVNSLEYLRLTREEDDASAAIDIINNLLFSHATHRDHTTLLYLSEQLLEIEKSSTSSIPGLSEYRIAQAANMSGNFQMGLDYAALVVGKSQHPQVLGQAKINQAIALAGLGRKVESRKLMSESDVNLTNHHLLNTETRRDVLYLGFLLAQGENEVLARKLYDRQLDVTARKFFENSSRDTTAMVAELENSRERQAERDAAAAREAKLQAITIERQRMLNRTLMALSAFFGCAALASFMFMKFRGRIVGELQAKTIEAASAEKLKTEFLGMISHELRTPLNGIIGISDVLANYHEDPDIRDKTGIVLKSGQALLSVVESLTDMARLDAGQLVLVPHNSDLASSFNDVPEPWAKLAQEKGLTFTYFVDPGITRHYVDEDRLVQCLNILLSNAVRFTPSGRVHLHITAHKPAGSEEMTLTAIVADTGRGMTEHVQSRLFTPFMQADTSLKRTHMGTGLSLAIAYGIVEMMNGTLSVVSREGRGSEFKLTVPLAPAQDEIPEILTSLPDEAATLANVDTNFFDDPTGTDVRSFSNVPVLESPAAPARVVVDLMQPRVNQAGLHLVPSSLEASVGDHQNILIVDDLESNRTMLRSVLNSRGHSYAEATEAPRAFDLLAQTSFDMVLLNIHMTSLDGVEFLRRIRSSRRAYADIPVVGITGENAASKNAACVQAGVDIFLTTPILEDELMRTITYLRNSDTHLRKPQQVSRLSS